MVRGDSGCRYIGHLQRTVETKEFFKKSFVHDMCVCMFDMLIDVICRRKDTGGGVFEDDFKALRWSRQARSERLERIDVIGFLGKSSVLVYQREKVVERKGSGNGRMNRRLEMIKGCCFTATQGNFVQCMTRITRQPVPCPGFQKAVDTEWQ